MEKLLNRKVFWVICQLHTNELPLRHLIECLGIDDSSYIALNNIFSPDGKSTSKDGFSGPIGKLLSKV